MRSALRLGSVNLALVTTYLAWVWGMEAYWALTSPYGGIDVRTHVTVAKFFQNFFDFGLDGLMRLSSIFGAIKLVIAAGCVAYLIEFARACVARREPDRETTDIVLLMALIAVVVWSLPVMTSDDVAFVQLRGTQLLLVAGAATVIIVERYIDLAAAETPTEAVDGASQPTDDRPLTA